MFRTFKYACLALVIGLIGAIIPTVIFQRAYAAGPAVVDLDAVLTRVSDGTAPFIAADPNGSNGLIATMDTASYTFDVNFNTLDAQPHSVNSVQIVATLTSTSSEVRWLLNSLPTACATKTLSPDSKTLTCGISGSYNTGTALNISGAWFAQGGVPNATDVDVQFSVSAVMSPNPGSVDNPTTAMSNIDTIEVVSEPSEYEIRKYAGNSSASLERDGSGNPEYVVVDWGVEVDLKSGSLNTIKGLSTSNLGTLTFDDLMNTGDSSQIPIQSQGEFVSCLDVTNASEPYYLPNSHFTTPGSANVVEDSGAWSCSQPGGTGEPVEVSVSGIKWGPRWFPNGKSGSPTKYWAYGLSSTPNDIYNNPSGENNQAAVATQLMRVRYPYSAVVAFDQTIGDRDARPNYITWCNELGNADVVGATDDIDEIPNNEACVSFINQSGPGNLMAKAFLKYQPTSTSLGPESDLGLIPGALRTMPNDGDSDNYLAPGMKFAMQLSFNVNANSVQGMNGFVMCDAFEQQKYHLITDGGSTPLASNFIDSGSHTYYNWFSNGTPAPGYSPITDADIVVEFASTGTTWSHSSEMRTNNCDSGSLDWQEDPADLSGGIESANLVRVRIINGKYVAPGLAVYVRMSMQSDEDLDKGDELYNMSQFKTSNLVLGGSLGGWQRPGVNCIPENHPWNSSSGSYSCQLLADRAIAIVPSPLTQISDQPSTPTLDQMLSAPLGDTKTFTIRSGTAYNTDAFPDGVHVYTTLPPGLEYESASIEPSAIISDCKASSNPDCLTDPSARTDVGYRTVVWDRGDFEFEYTNDDGTVQADRTLFGTWTLTTRVGAFVPNGVGLQLLAWTTADSGLEDVTYPIQFRTSGTGNHDDTVSGPVDDDWISVATAQAFGVEKYVSETEIPLNGIAKYTLAFGNLTGTAKVIDLIDILPFNNDGRLENTEYEGGYGLIDVIDVSNFINQIYVTSTDSDDIDPDPNNNSAVGTGIWSCTYAQIGTSGCPERDEVTALRIVTDSMVAGQYGLVQLQLETFNNDGAEAYSNNFTARATGLALPTLSSDVTVHTPSCTTVGNRLFVDVNKNGKYDDGEPGIEGVEISLMTLGDDDDPYTDDDSIYKVTTTDADGNWYIECVAPGQYYAAIDPSQFDDGPLEGYEVAPDGVEDVGNGEDESDDHNLLFEDALYHTGVFTVDYDGPLGEDGIHPASDAFDNLTIDLGVVPVDIPEPPTTTTTTVVAPPSAGGNSTNGLLPTTGKEIAGLIVSALLLVGAGLVLRKKRIWM